MANRFWVGGTAAWDGTAGTKWSTTSGGGGGSAIPTAADDVFFDGSSGSGTVTISSGNTGARSINCTSFAGTLAGSASISIGDATAGASNVAFKLVAGMAGYTYTGDISFISTSATQQTVTSGGKTINNLTFNGVGASWLCNDALSMAANRSITHTKGTLTFSGNVTFATGNGAISSANANTRTLTLGSGTFTFSPSSSATILDLSTTTGLTFSGASSTIVHSGTSTAIINLATSQTFGTISVTSTGTLTLTATAGMTAGTLSLAAGSTTTFTAGQTLTISTGFTATGTSGSLVTFGSSVAGSAITVQNNGAMVMSDFAAISDVTWKGYVWYAGPNSKNNGGNTNVIFGFIPQPVIRTGTAQAGAASTITLDANASATDNLYQDALVWIFSGTGAGQVRSGKSYVGSTKVLTIFPNWTTNPDSTSVFVLLPFGQVDVGNWLNNTIPAASTAGVPLVDVSRINNVSSSSVTTVGAFIGNATAALAVDASGRVDIGKLLGTAWLTPAVAGTPDVNAKQIGGQTASASGTITFPTGTLANTTNITAGTITTCTTVTTVTNQLTAAQIATGVWQDTAAGDFTLANSVGKSIMNGVALGTGLTVARCTLTDTLTTYTGNTVQTGDSFARIGAAGVSLSAIPDLAGVTTLLSRLSATRAGYLDNLSAGAVALASGVTVTTNNDKTGYSLTQAFPTNFSALGITAGGHISTVDTCTTNTDMRGTDNAALAATALSSATWTPTRAGYLDNLSGGAVALASSLPANFSALVISATGIVQADVESVRGQALTGTGTSGDPWGPA